MNNEFSLRMTFSQDSFESDEIDEEQSNKLENCLLCLSKNICLVIIICTIVFLMGLIGSAVSIYFLTAGKIFIFYTSSEFQYFHYFNYEKCSFA